MTLKGTLSPVDSYGDGYKGKAQAKAKAQAQLVGKRKSG